MSGSAVEIDFFRAETPKKLSFHDIQDVISKINPKLLKTAIASASAKNGSALPVHKSFSVPSSPKECQFTFPALPVYTPTSIHTSDHQTNQGTAPMTIFYNGTVAVFDVSHHQAEEILKLALGGSSKPIESAESKLVVPPSNQQKPLMEPLHGDLPFARKTSLRRFLEKRKERQTSMTPYASPSDKHK